LQSSAGFVGQPEGDAVLRPNCATCAFACNHIIAAGLLLGYCASLGAITDRNLEHKTKLCMIQGSHFSAAKGGAQYQADVLVEQLVRTGDFEVTFITRNVANGFVPEGYAVEQLTPNRWLKRLGFVADTRQLQQTLYAHQPDVIYQQGLKGHTGIAARYARSSGARFVFHVASDFDVLPSSKLSAFEFKSVSGIDKKLGEWGLRKADDIVVQTTVQQQLLAQHYQRNSSLLVKNFHPFPAENVERGDTIRVIWVANFKAVKRPELFVDLAAHFADRSDCEFVMAGRGGDDATYGELHKRMRALGNLRFLGEISQDEVNREIAASHILVNTSSMEGFPNTFVQAWMRGLPVVSQGVNTDNLFDSEMLGYCASDFPTLVARIEDLVNDSALRETLGENGRTYALENHSLHNVNPLIDLLRASR